MTSAPEAVPRQAPRADETPTGRLGRLGRLAHLARFALRPWRFWRHEPIRYLVIGVLNTALAYGEFLAIYALFVRLHVHYMIALAAVTVANVTTSFFTQRAFVFRSRGRALPEYFRFYAVYAVPIAFGFLAFPFCKEVLHLKWYVAQAVIVGVSTVASYFGHKFISFRHPAPKAGFPVVAPASQPEQVAPGRDG